MKEGFSKYFINFNKEDGKVYNNFYLDDFKLIIRCPLTGKEEEKSDIKIEPFTFASGVYLLSY
jgi:hypothetical protein